MYFSSCEVPLKHFFFFSPITKVQGKTNLQKKRAETSQTMAYSDSWKQSSQLWTCEKVVWKLWGSYKNVVIKLWDSCEKVVRKIWEIYGKVVRMLWGNCEKVVRKFWESFEKVVRMLWKSFEKVVRKPQESCDIIYCVEEPDYIKNNKNFFFFLNQKIIPTLKKGCILFFSPILDVYSLNMISRSIQIKKLHKGDKQQTDIAANQ